MSSQTILAIETSCDETAVAVLQKKADEIIVLADVIASQIDIHKTTGGVVPEVAAREHAAIIQPLVKQVIKESGLSPTNLTAIAVTIGPGLMPALSVGVTAAQTLAYAWLKPIIPVHHLEGHIYSALLRSAEKSPTIKSPSPKHNQLLTLHYSLPTNSFPALALLVSGGHTMLVAVTNHWQYQVLGSTRDDAAGEAFDKVARMLSLPYPGGPHLSQLAKTGDPAAFDFARPMKNSGDLDFSFSGLKTEVLYTLRDINHPLDKGESGAISEQVCQDVAASFQQAVVDILVAKTKKTLFLAHDNSFQTLLLAGGVAANQLLRKKMKELAAEQNIPLRIAPLNLCGDNAIMIAQAAFFAHQSGRHKKWPEIDPQARINLENYSTI